MSAVKIVVRFEGYGNSIGRTVVYVDEKFAYQTGNAVSVEIDNITKLITLAGCDNIEVGEK